MSEQLSEVISEAVKRAFAAGVRAGKAEERQHILKAIDLNASGDKLYLTDFEDALKELDAERQKTSLPQAS
jgi:hypothetical protein